jgi:hypothetical protein
MENARPPPAVPLVPLIDEPGMFDTPEMWERHLKSVESMPESPARAAMITAAQNVLAWKRGQRT